MNNKFAKSYLVLRGLDKPAVTGYYADQVALAYGFPSGVDATGMTIGIVELGGQYYPSDLQTFCQARNLPVPTVEVVQVNGATITPDPNGADVEVMLDVENVAAAFPGCKQKIYFADNTEDGFIAAVKQATLECDTVSVSWGAPEDQWSSQGVSSLQSVINSSSTPVFVASGDSGSTDGEPGLHVDFPASVGFACGGTSLVLNGSNIQSEKAWSGSGGGISALIAKPAYQNGISILTTNRGVPDIAGSADPNYPYNVYVNGSWVQVGGTSAVAPLMAALFTMIKKLNGSLASPLQSVVYVSGNCRDITSGSNYSAGIGYDLVTGNGVPIPSKLLGSINPPTPTPTPTPIPTPTPSPTPPPTNEGVLKQAIDALFAILINDAGSNVELVTFLKDLQTSIDSELPILFGGAINAWQFNFNVLYKLYLVKKQRS